MHQLDVLLIVRELVEYLSFVYESVVDCEEKVWRKGMGID